VFVWVVDVLKDVEYEDMLGMWALKNVGFMSVQ
jgi:hypothetical protein